MKYLLAADWFISGGYMNRHVALIVGITSRQVISWSEKGLVDADEDTKGSGSKRIYSYTNLLEFGLCKELLGVGVGIRTVKRILGDLRASGNLQSWAEDFQGYYKEIWERDKKRLKSKDLPGPYRPDKPEGVLAYFFNESNPIIHIVAWDMEYALQLDIIKKAFQKNTTGLLVDIGKIKERIDYNIDVLKKRETEERKLLKEVQKSFRGVSSHGLK